MEREEKIINGFRMIIGKLSVLNCSYMDKDNYFNSSEVHFIDYIYKNPDYNVKKISDDFYMTPGAITKLSKKLISRGVIEVYRKDTNRKETYFKLTQKGLEARENHYRLYKLFQKRDSVIFKSYSDRDIELILDFVNNYNQHLNEQIEKCEK